MIFSVRLPAELETRLFEEGWVSFEFDRDRPLLEVALCLGAPVASHRGGPLVDVLTPKAAESAPRRSLSAAHGLGAFPFHTDGAQFLVPPRYVVLRLASRLASRRPTFLAPIDINSLSDAERALLEYDVWVVDGGRGRLLTSILNFDLIPAVGVVRFDRHCMAPAHHGFGRSADALDRLCRAREIAWSWAPGQVLIIDNWRTLHGRGNDPRVDEVRELERVLVRA